jgi:hypothetical protein
MLEEDIIRGWDLRIKLLHVSKELCTCAEKDRDFYQEIACVYAKKIKKFNRHIYETYGINIS